MHIILLIVRSLIICVAILYPPFAMSETTGKLSFQINFVYRSGGKGDLKPLDHGETLYSGDHYKIIFTANSNCHVYIFQIDSSDQAFQLFPMTNFKNVYVNNKNPVKSGIRYNIPSPQKAFTLDNITGAERIYFIATSQRNAEMENLMNIIKDTSKNKLNISNRNLASTKNAHHKTPLANGKPEEKIERLFKSRGMKIVNLGTPLMVEWNNPNDLFTIMDNRLTGLRDTCFYMLDFVHN